MLTFQIQPKEKSLHNSQAWYDQILPSEEQFGKNAARIERTIMLKKIASLNLIKADDIGMINFFKNGNFSL